MIKNIYCPIRTIKKIHDKVYCLSFTSRYLAQKARPGQFVHINMGCGFSLRRPFSIHKVKGNEIFLLFKVVGRGTQQLMRYRTGDVLNILGPLGQGFSFKDINKYSQVFLVAGGMGVAPLIFLSQKLSRCPSRKQVLLGAKTRKDLICRRDFGQRYRISVASDDGSIGMKGSVVNVLADKLKQLKNKRDRVKIYVCGPKAMFAACANLVKKYPLCDCEVSFEQFMGCGIGACLGCVIDTKGGYKRVCKDGPVFDIRDIF